MTTEEGGIRIGELLVRAGVITAADLSEAEKLSSHMKMQFGRLLIMAGCLTEEALECALEAQALIKQGLLSFDIAIEALGFAVEEKMSLKEALELLDVLPQYGTSTLKLAELIGEAAIIPDDRLIQSLELSVESNIPLGDVLVAELCIPPTLLPLLARFQDQIRTDNLDRPRALEELRGTFFVWQRADYSIASDPLAQSPIQKERPLTAKSGRDNSYRQVFPVAGGGTTATPPRSPSEPDDGWIREDFSKRDQGKQSSEEVVIFSDGYFAEHERPSFDGNTFDNIPRFVPAVEEISNDDEQRINDLLDIFAEDTSTQIQPLRDPQFESSFLQSSPSPVSQPPAAPIERGFVPPPSLPVEPPKLVGDELGLAGPLPKNTIKALQALAFGAPADSPPPVSIPRTAPPAASSIHGGGDNEWRAVEPTNADAWHQVESQSAQSADSNWQEFETNDRHEESQAEDYIPEPSSVEGNQYSVPQEVYEEEVKIEVEDKDESAEPVWHEVGEPQEPAAAAAAFAPQSVPFEFPSAPSRTSHFDQNVSGEMPAVMPSIRKVDKASTVFGQLDFGDPEPPSSEVPAVELVESLPQDDVKLEERADSEVREEHEEPPEIADDRSAEPVNGSEVTEVTDEVEVTEAPQTSFINPEVVTKISQSPESFFVHLGQALAEHISPIDEPETAKAEDFSPPTIAANENDVDAQEGNAPPVVSETATGEFDIEPRSALRKGKKKNAADAPATEPKMPVSEVETEVAKSESAKSEPIAEVVEEKSEAATQESIAEAPAEIPAAEPQSEAFIETAENRAIESHSEVETAENRAIESHSEVETAENPAIEASVHTSAIGDVSAKGKGKKKGKAGAVTVATVATPAEEQPADVVHLLQTAGFFKESDLHASFTLALNDATLAPEILRVLGIVDKSVLDAAVRVHKLIKEGTVDVHRAVESLESIKTGKLKPADLTHEFGIKKSKRRK